MPQNAFRRGFLDGWSSIRGSEPGPTIPTFSVGPGTDPYRAGVACGVREAANLKTAAKGSSAIDAWFDNALRFRGDRSRQGALRPT
jgi:hypothetical protein